MSPGAVGPIPGSRVWLDGRAAVLTRFYGDLAAVVYDGENVVVMVPRSCLTQRRLDKIGRGISGVIVRKTFPPPSKCPTRTARYRAPRSRPVVRRSCGSRASPARPRKPDDEDLAPRPCPLAGGLLAVPGWSR